MAQPSTLRWTKLMMYVGDGGSPESFTSKNCGLTTKQFTIAGSASETTVPDCDDPDAPSWIERVIQSLSSTFEGSGIFAEENYDFFAEWALSGAAKNCRIVVDGTTETYFAGSYLMTNFQITGNQNDGKMQFSGQFQSDGAVSKVTGSP